MHKPTKCVHNVDGVTNSLHIMTSITSTSIRYARCVNLNVYANCDFLLPVSIILAVFLVCAHVSSQEGRYFMHLIFILANLNEGVSGKAGHGQDADMNSDANSDTDSNIFLSC